MTNGYFAWMLTFLGVVVKPGETVKCDPGDSHYHISTVCLHTLFISGLLAYL